MGEVRTVGNVVGATCVGDEVGDGVGAVGSHVGSAVGRCVGVVATLVKGGPNAVP